MNYFEHHIGDYDQATAHLTACEDGIYSRMIRWYMASESPLPADLKLIQRRVRAHSRDEKAAVQTVLGEFFELRDSGYHQHRCDEEVARFKSKQAKARCSAEARWSAQRSQLEGNANASPNADAEGVPTQCEGNAKAMRTHMPTQCEGNAPRARPQTPDTKQLRSKATSLVAANPRPTRKAPPDLALSADMQAWAAEHAPMADAEAELAKLKDHTFATARSDWDGTLRNWLRKAQEDAEAKAARSAPKPRANAPDDEPQWRREQRARNVAFLGPAASPEARAAVAAERARNLGSAADFIPETFDAPPAALG